LFVRRYVWRLWHEWRRLFEFRGNKKIGKDSQILHWRQRISGSMLILIFFLFHIKCVHCLWGYSGLCDYIFFLLLFNPYMLELFEGWMCVCCVCVDLCVCVSMCLCVLCFVLCSLVCAHLYCLCLCLCLICLYDVFLPCVSLKKNTAQKACRQIIKKLDRKREGRISKEEWLELGEEGRMKLSIFSSLLLFWGRQYSHCTYQQSC